MSKDTDDTYVCVHFDDEGYVCRVEVHGRDGQWWGRGEPSMGRHRIVTYVPRTMARPSAREQANVRDEAHRRLTAARAQSAESGTNRLTTEEIDAEIKRARVERANKALSLSPRRKVKE